MQCGTSEQSCLQRYASVTNHLDDERKGETSVLNTYQSSKQTTSRTPALLSPISKQVQKIEEPDIRR